MSKKVIIIGAGYGSLSLANLLAKSGYDVSVYEKNSASGGRIQSVKKDGFTFDLGPSWYLMPEVFDQYYQLFDESAQDRLDIVRFSPGYKVWFENNKSIEIIGDVKQDAKTFEAIETGAGDKLIKYVNRSSLTYEMAVKYFLYNNFTSIKSVIKWPVIKNSPLMFSLVSKYLDKYVSKYFKDLRLRQLLEYHMVFLGSSPFHAPAIYSLMSHLDFKSGVFYPKKGMLYLATDLEKLGRKLGVKYFYNQPVEKIITKNSLASGIQLASGDRVTADIVVSGADLHFTETKLLQPTVQTYPKKYWQKRQPGPGGLLISFGIKGELRKLRHHNLYFVRNWRKNFSDIYEDKQIPENTSIYVCNPTKTDSKMAPKNHENLFVLMPLPSGVKLSSDQQVKLIEKTIEILEEMADVSNLKNKIVSQLIYGPQDFESQFNAWQYNAFGGESHILKQSVIFRTNNQSKKIDNLYYVGAGTLPGIGLPMCLISAQLTYKKIVGLNSDGPLKKGEL